MCDHAKMRENETGLLVPTYNLRTLGEEAGVQGKALAT